MTHLVEKLTKNGYQCLSHTEIPSNDGGLPLGQGAIAIARTTEST